MTLIAQFKSIESDYLTYDDEGLARCSSFIRTSEYVDVDFPLLSPDVIVPLEVAALKRAKAEAVKKHAAVVATIDERISKLLAITHQPAAA